MNHTPFVFRGDAENEDTPRTRHARGVDRRSGYADRGVPAQRKWLIVGDGKSNRAGAPAGYDAGDGPCDPRAAAAAAAADAALGLLFPR